MSNQLKLCLLLISIFVCNVIVAGNDCPQEKTCGSCIQHNGTCSWCLSPDFHGASRCETKGTLLREGCSESSIYQPVNELHLRENSKISKKVSLKPQRVILNLVPNTPSVLPVRGFLMKKDPQNRLGGSIKLIVKAPTPLQVTTKSDCNEKYKSPRETSSCYGIHNGQAVLFTFIITTKECFPKKKVIKVKVKGMKKSQMIILVKAKCHCDCELEKPIVNSEFHCNGNGKMVCGQCECSNQTQGKNCECTKDQDIDEKNCIEPGSQVVCSARGRCHCGSCRCSPHRLAADRYSGRYCECDRMGCRKFNNAICGGPSHGICKCGKCICRKKYTGEACEIDVNTQKCLSPSGQICSGRGKCINNQCKCDAPFSGKICENTENIIMDLNVHCIKSGTTEICSNKGQCIKGLCYCNKIPNSSGAYTGLYCECDDTSCPTSDGKICGGRHHGVCDCGRCRCQQQYTGEACESDLSTQDCLSPNGVLCNEHGVCTDNKCQCQPPYTGRVCENLMGEDNLEKKCVMRYTTAVCSDRGKCLQGACQCNKIPKTKLVYTGEYCECDDTSCPTFKRKICGGKKRGICNCGTCQCKHPHSGKACGKSSNTNNCLSANGKLCSGRGRCINAQCQCDEPFYGTVCEKSNMAKKSIDSSCKQNDTSDVCSNRGTCIQGNCECDTIRGSYGKYTGSFCECDDYSCPFSNGQICGGRDHGVCQCGKCQCELNFEGDACERDLKAENCDSPKGVCSNHGVCWNNQCICDKNYFGKKCEFNLESEQNLTARCIQSNTSKVCSRQGDCFMGICHCNRTPPKRLQYYGRFCECNDYNCEYSNGLLCGGLTRGTCKCGKCLCEHPFEGSDCSISTAKDKCMASNGLLCNAHGDCINNQCRCEGIYRGPTCEDCPTCGNRCNVMKQCVLCKVFGTGTLTFEQCIKCDPIYLVDSLDNIYSDKRKYMCIYTDDYDDCVIRFVLQQGPNNKMTTYALRKKECNPNGYY
ncbi:integrin beta pat-3 [Argonauta hians]